MSKLDSQPVSFLMALCSILLLLWVLFPSQLHAATIDVGPDQDHKTIQSALNDAQANDTIFVEIGTYTENIVLQNGIIIEGEDTAQTIIVGTEVGVDTVAITGNSSISNTTIINTVTGSAAISISPDVTGVSVANNLIMGSSTGIGSAAISISPDVTGASFTNNVIVGSNTGIECAASSTLSIINNVIDGNTSGITCTGPTTITFENNIVSNNTTGINFSSVTDTTNYNDVYGNTINSYTPGPTDLNSDPKFADPDPTINDYHLQIGSACLDMGDPATSFNDAQVSTSPIDHSRNDCGAYGGPNRDVTPFQAQNVVPTTSVPDMIDLSWNANLAYNTVSYKIYFDNQVHTITNDIPNPPYSNILTIPVAAANCQTTSTPPTCTTTLPLALTAPASFTVAFGNEELFLNWSAPSNLVTHYNVYFKKHTDPDTAYMSQDTGSNATSYTLTGLMNRIEYDVYVTAVVSPTFFINVTALDDYMPPHESHLLDPNKISIPINGGIPSESPGSTVVSNTPQPVVPFPDLPDQGHCFIATAAYGSQWEPQVKILRAFRDEYLEHYNLGRRFIAWYYHASPPWAQYLNEHVWLKPMVRAVLIPAVGFAYFFVAATGTDRLLIFLLVALGLIGGTFVVKKAGRSRD